MNTKPHKHAALIIAWANGAEIECQDSITGIWAVLDAPGGDRQPAWLEDFEYRVKPVPQASDEACRLIVDAREWALAAAYEAEHGTATTLSKAQEACGTANLRLKNFILDLEQKVLDLTSKV